MRVRFILILIGGLMVPGLLPAPALPPGGDAFGLLDRMRSELLRKDKAHYTLKYRSFKKTLAKYESNNNWKEYNRYGFIGKYQFGKSALAATGYDHVSLETFKADPSCFPEQDQEKAMDMLLRLNESALKDEIRKYVGLVFSDSVRITRMGILAAAHLAGPANVNEYLESFGEENARDRMGTRISDYIYRFSR